MGKAAERDKALDIRLSPIGFYLLGLDYLASADCLAERQTAADDSLYLRFELPIRHMYAHAWELCLKACIYQQGILPSAFKRSIGHSLVAAWDLVDKEQFAMLALTPDTRLLVERLDNFHPAKWYAYPVTGTRRDWTLTYIRTNSQRLNLSQSDISAHFGTNKHELGDLRDFPISDGAND